MYLSLDKDSTIVFLEKLIEIAVSDIPSFTIELAVWSKEGRSASAAILLFMPAINMPSKSSISTRLSKQCSSVLWQTAAKLDVWEPGITPAIPMLFPMADNVWIQSLDPGKNLKAIAIYRLKKIHR